MTAKRYSRQRELIYQALCRTRDHPTAEMLYRMLKPDNPSLSLGTVYRNLDLLSREGLITRMPFPVERYDADAAPHPHLSCRRCGGVSDLELPYDSALDRAAEQAGCRVDSHTTLFIGLCPRCARAEEEE